VLRYSSPAIGRGKSDDYDEGLDPCFRLRHGGRDIDLYDGKSYVVGRDARCAIHLDDRLVSREHATIEVAVEGVTVEDLGTRNGTVLDGKRIEPGLKVTLEVGNRLLIGSQELTLLLPRVFWPPPSPKDEGGSTPAAVAAHARSEASDGIRPEKSRRKPRASSKDRNDA
jgi:predicted component of type VI protein secretion system